MGARAGGGGRRGSVRDAGREREEENINKSGSDFPFRVLHQRRTMRRWVTARRPSEAATAAAASD